MAARLTPAQVLARIKAGKGKKISKKKRQEAARELGRAGGLVGGHARADALTYDQRVTIAIHAINQRYGYPCPKDCPYNHY